VRYVRAVVPKVLVDVDRPHDVVFDDAALRQAASRALQVPASAIVNVRVARQALDARKRRRVPTYLLTLEVETSQDVSKRAQARPAPPPSQRLESPRAPKDAPPIVVVGAGPAGAFAAWHLAEHGAKVIWVERGKPVETRARDFGRFRGRGILDPESNLCFGEGGAGTYSDGKLTCRKNDPVVQEVLERLVEVGAPERILVDKKPHIGTNLLFRVLKGLRAQLVECGVDIHFETRLERLRLQDRRVTGVDTSRGQLDAPHVLLAIGHSARDTYETLHAQGVPMIAKPFAVGVRAEHPQPMIDRAQYNLRKPPRPSTLPAADYRLAERVDGVGVYSFCMCPGGMIVPTATEPEMVVVNGMSSARRSTPFANSGVVVEVSVDRIREEGHGDDGLAGVRFQRALERRAYEVGGGDYRAPAMRVSDFVARRPTGRLADSNFRPGLTAVDLDEALPPFVAASLRTALGTFDRRIRGYATTEQANLIAVESRTSSPLRIPRDNVTCSVEGFEGLYVAGEGPGYAGGIMSAAVDGLKVAHQILCNL
jgi:uncharacterized FAD-dependent dehydrogenase